MRIAFVVPFYSQSAADPDAALSSFPILRELPPAVARQGHQVKVLLHAPVPARRRIDRVAYEFIQPGTLLKAGGALLDRWKPRYGPAYYQPAWRLTRRLLRLRPDVVHFFGLTMDVQLALVARAARRVGARLFVHYHGGLPGESAKLRWLQRHNLKHVEKVLFTTPDQANPWIEAGLLDGSRQVARVLETSSPFRGLPKHEARDVAGMHGDPVCLSAGRLHAIKDPLTVLRGFAHIAEKMPDARLYLYYLTDEMLPELQQLVATDPQLVQRVEFRGRTPLHEMEAIYSSADFLLQASAREWSGLSVLEAMSCGCIPIVTRIPSFEMMTASGRFGRLFEIGDDAALAKSVLDLDRTGIGRLSDEVKLHFERELSFPAIAGQLDRLYRESGPDS